MSIFDYFRVTKAQTLTPTPNYAAEYARDQIQRESDAYLASKEQENGARSVESTDNSFDQWVLESTQTLPAVVWAPMDKFPSRPAKQTKRICGHGYFRYDEAMILRPRSVTMQQLESTGRRFA